MMKRMTSDADVLLRAFARRWARWSPRRVYTPVRRDDLAQEAGLPPERFQAALLHLLNHGLLAARGAIRPPSETGWTYQFTMEGLKLALERGFLTQAQVVQ